MRSVIRHPWTSVQDFLLISGAMIGAVVLALEYELFSFASELTVSERRITLGEAIFLTALLATCIVSFIVRRLREERLDQVREFALDLEIRDLRQQALQDPLTGLPNRRAVMNALAQATSGPVSDGHKHAFFLLDLNEFKRVNDMHGHAAGDRALQAVVERLKAAARPADLLARLGGDEFALLAYDVSREGARAIGQRLISALKGPIWVEGDEHEIGVSIGATLIPEDGVTAPEILRNADRAMYDAKQARHSAIEFFTSAPKDKPAILRA